MRTRISDKKRMIIITVAIILAIATIAFLVWKLQSYTKSLHEDISRASVICTRVTVLSDGDIPADIPFSEEQISAVKSAGGPVCALNLEYTFFSNITEKIKNFSIDVKSAESAPGKVYAYTDIAEISVLDNAYTMSQTLIVDKEDIRDSYFEEELPKAFKGPYRYELSYTVEGLNKEKTIGFTTAGKQ